MKRFSSAILLGSGFLVLSLSAPAQTYGGGYTPYPPREGSYAGSPRRGEGYYGGSYRYGRGPSLIGHVLADLDRAAVHAHLDGHEAKHFEEASRKLQEFEDRWARGRFDTGKLDKAIDNLQHLAEADRVYWRDRELLARDLAELRRFRTTRGFHPEGFYDEYRNDRYHRGNGPYWR